VSPLFFFKVQVPANSLSLLSPPFNYPESTALILIVIFLAHEVLRGTLFERHNIGAVAFYCITQKNEQQR